MRTNQPDVVFAVGSEHQQKQVNLFPLVCASLTSRQMSDRAAPNQAEGELQVGLITSGKPSS